MRSERSSVGSLGQSMGYVNMGQSSTGLYDNPNHGQVYTEIAVNNTPRSRAPIQTTYAQLEQGLPQMMGSNSGSNQHLIPQQQPQTDYRQVHHSMGGQFSQYDR